MLIESEFTINNFKKNPNNGYITLTLFDDDLKMIKNIEQQVYSKVLKEFKLEAIDQIRLTPKTWDMMFRTSTFGNNIKLSADKSSIGIFDKNSNKKDSLEEWNCITEGTEMNVLIEPCFLWFMNKRAGISWVIRQMRFLNDVNVISTWIMEDD